MSVPPSHPSLSSSLLSSASSSDSAPPSPSSSASSSPSPPPLPCPPHDKAAPAQSAASAAVQSYCPPSPNPHSAPLHHQLQLTEQQQQQHRSSSPSPELTARPTPSRTKSPPLKHLVSSERPERKTSLRNLRRNSRTFPSLLSRFSAVPAGNTSPAATPTPLQPARSLRHSSNSSPPHVYQQHRQPPSHNHADRRPRDDPGNQASPSVQPAPASHTTLQSYKPAAPLHTTAVAHPDPYAAKRRQLLVSNPDRSRRSSMTSQTQTPESKSEKDKKMHQTSSRLLRMTDDDRPFTRDFKDLFSTLMVSLPLTPHRVRFLKVDHTFSSEEAITNLGSLKFSQSNRMPDPKDPSRIVTTTTTTTFSMAKEMARSVCAKFLEARFIESVDGKTDFHSKSSVWQLTPKGMSILHGFCQRNGITARHVMELLESSRNTMHLVILERESDTDKIHRDHATIEVVFRRFVGQDGPNVKSNTTASDSDSLHDYQTGLIGVKMAHQRKIGDKSFWNTFTGKATQDWLMDCCMMVDRRETTELATLFVDHGLMASLEPTHGVKFSPTKSTIYQVTDKGKRVAGWVASPKEAINGEANGRSHPSTVRDSNANRMTVIIKDPALRLLFREFLRDTHCDENLSFYLDVREFLNTYNAAKKSSQTPRLEVIRETLAAAYSLYNAFLAPGSPCELNIDHSLRTALASRMTRAVGDDEAMIKSLDEVATLFDQAQHSVFKLMASDSVPKFMREARYAQILRERNLDAALGGPMTVTHTSSSL